MPRPVAIDFFAGCGGMSLGLEAAGFDVAVSVEYDPVHALVHHYNFPYGKTICKDVTDVSADEIHEALRERGYTTEIDVIVGGPPCQGFSHMGKRQLDDPRNSLVFEYRRLVAELRPKYFVFENVPGIASGEHKRFLAELIEEFANAGYRIEQPWQILDASEYGAPQKRRRLILIGSRNDVRPARYPIPSHGIPKGKDVISPEVDPTTTVSQAIADLAGICAFTGTDTGIDPENLDYSGFRESYSVRPSGLFAKCHVRGVPDKVYCHVGSVHTQVSIDRFAATEPGTVEPTSRFLKLSPSGQCNTLRAGTGREKGAYTAPRPIHYSVPRCITVREAARLHTFPDWFAFHSTIWHGFREIGNAVIPMLAKELGESILDAMGVADRNFETKILKSVDDRLLNMNMTQAETFWKIESSAIPMRKRVATEAEN